MVKRERSTTRKRRHLFGELISGVQGYARAPRGAAATVDFRRAHAALVRATKLADVVRIWDSAEAIRVAAQKAKAGLAMANQAAELRIRAERKAGRLLLGVERSDAGRPTKNSHHRGGNFARVLHDLDLADTTARRWQAEAKIAADVFEDHIREMTTAGEELTSAGLLRSVQRPLVPTDSGATSS